MLMFKVPDTLGGQTLSGAMAHVIRLRGPWTFGEQGQTVRCDWTEAIIDLPIGQGNPAATAERFLQRAFGRPLNVPAGEQVWLVITGSAAGLTIALNGEVLANTTTPDDLRFEVTGRLLPRNELRITGFASASAWPLGDVRLEFLPAR